ncbi:hypothetical protein LJR289_001565 [Pseudoduganella sp. LjRoot289]|uniref:hypothetical protein n=1 Tax=Pseudoduganella sp. LjRoot289 TaxID=3342314 RepID=UPI003ECF8084
MNELMNPFLVTAALLSATAALAHMGCIVFGAEWYRFFGAGEHMARMAAAGQLLPTVITSIIVLVLAGWSLYAFAAAGAAFSLPLMRWVMAAITGIYLLRGLAFLPLAMLNIDLGRSMGFWYWSSAVCLFIGVLHLAGLLQVWQRL